MKPGMSMRQSIQGYAGMSAEADSTIHDSIRLDGHIVGLIRSFSLIGRESRRMYISSPSHCRTRTINIWKWGNSLYQKDLCPCHREVNTLYGLMKVIKILRNTMIW